MKNNNSNSIQKKFDDRFVPDELLAFISKCRIKYFRDLQPGDLLSFVVSSSDDEILPNNLLYFKIVKNHQTDKDELVYYYGTPTAYSTIAEEISVDASKRICMILSIQQLYRHSENAAYLTVLYMNRSIMLKILRAPYLSYFIVNKS